VGPQVVGDLHRLVSASSGGVVLSLGFSVAKRVPFAVASRSNHKTPVVYQRSSWINSAHSTLFIMGREGGVEGGVGWKKVP
jgi:hypothetical protein